MPTVSPNFQLSQNLLWRVIKASTESELASLLSCIEIMVSTYLLGEPQKYIILPSGNVGVLRLLQEEPFHTSASFPPVVFSALEAALVSCPFSQEHLGCLSAPHIP